MIPSRLRLLLSLGLLVAVPFLFYTTPPSTVYLIMSDLQRSNIFSLKGGSGGEPRCLPHNHIMFLKTHKCASSTVQNIFFRYGYTRNLTFALPRMGNYLGNPVPFQASMMHQSLLPQGGKVDIFTVHTRLNAAEHSKILHNNTLWVTIVRDPTMLFESLFNYFHLSNAYKHRLSRYLKLPMKELKSLPRSAGNKFGKNQMLFDMGYPDNIAVNDVHDAVDHLDSLFNLVMVSEFMDESLILLRHLLCWSLQDIVYFTKNARRQEVKLPLDPDLLPVLRELNSADVILYNHFLAKHKKAVLEFGVKRMADEVAELRGLQDEYYDACGVQKVKGADARGEFKEYSGLVSAYVTSNTTDQNCRLLSLPELRILDMVRNSQRSVLDESLENQKRTIK